MMSELRIAKTVEGLDKADPVPIDDFHISIDKADPTSEEVVLAMHHLSGVNMEFSVSAKQFARRMRHIMRSLFPYILVDRGYIIVNCRGRNKLVDIRRLRREQRK